MIDTELFPNNCTKNLAFGVANSIEYDGEPIICPKDFPNQDAPWIGYMDSMDGITGLPLSDFGLFCLR